MQPDLLSQLQDIQTPEQIGNWPLAWGWWVVIILSFLFIVLICISAYGFFKKRQAKKQALKLLNQVEPSQNPIMAVQSINNILKRVVLAYCERDLVANLNGDKWAIWLNENGHKNVQIAPEFVLLAYQANCSSEQASEYLKQSKAWINKSLPLSNRNKGEQHV
jgi:hypothetical protein